MLESLNWVEWSNPVAIWWMFLASVSVLNILMWIWTWHYFNHTKRFEQSAYQRVMISLSAAYVFGCAFRSFLPRADVQKICLFDTWFSSVLVGRSVATIAELSFVAQWALVLFALGKIHSSNTTRFLALLFVPIIAVAECFSWFAVITTKYIGNTIEESLWAVTYTLIGISLIALFVKVRESVLRWSVGFAILGCILYVLFMVNVDVPMYWGRWQESLASGKSFHGLIDGLQALNSNWIVTRDIADWKSEIPWMSLYFSVAVWTSLGLCYVFPKDSKPKAI